MEPAADGLILGLFGLRLVIGLVVTLLERGAQDVAERSAAVGGAVFRQRFLLFGHFKRLDRDADLAGLAIELGDAGVHLLAGRKALGALFATVAREIGAPDEGREIGTDDLDLDAGL